MAYYSGTATSLANLLTALTTAAVADGWTLTGSVLSKAGVYFQLTSDSDNIKCLGCESNAVANPAPGAVMIGRVHTSVTMAFPCNYEVFGFAQEIYLVVNYSVDKYQWMAFGKSTVPGLSGQGGWCAATIGRACSTFSGGTWIYMTMTLGGSSGNWSVSSPAPFSASFINVDVAANYWINHGLDSLGWNLQVAGRTIGWQHIAQLQKVNPSAWNSETVLLPIRAFLERPSYKSSLIVDLAYARLLRMDNLTPGDILTIGSDKWKAFPFYQKNSAIRDAQTGLGAPGTHTGTFGWAIKYEGA